MTEEARSAARTQGASNAVKPDLSGSIPVERVNEHLTEEELREVHEGIERALLGESAAKKPRVVTTVTGVPRELVERRRSSSWVRGSFWFACTWFALGFLFAELVLR